jgi:fumarylacetoacetate (FAA) hydrolase family protein
MKKFAKLRGKIIEVFGSQVNYAKAMNQTPTNINKKLNGKTAWTQKDIIKSCELLSIDNSEIGIYFF